MNTLDKKQEVKLKVEEILTEDKAELVDFNLFISRGKSTVRCFVDKSVGGITTSDCVKINKRIVSYLEESAILGEDYVVEVNSPGLDRPLKSERDFHKVKGRSISLWLNEPVNDKSYLEGELTEIKKGKLFLINKNDTIEVDIDKVKLGKEIIKI